MKKPVEDEGLDVRNHPFMATGKMEIQPRKVNLARPPASVFVGVDKGHT